MDNTLVVIPARGGSKGVPGKNIKPLAGKPMILYTVEAAQAVFSNDDICVSTDDAGIAQVVADAGLAIPFLRPADLASDASSTYDVLLHALEYYRAQGKNYTKLVLMQATSPFRTRQHLEEALTLFSEGIEMIVSVKETEANPYYVLFEENGQGFLEKSKKGNFSSRQECPKVWQYNGAIYIMDVASLLLRSHLSFTYIKKYEMQAADSLDIDTPLDWEFAEFMMGKKATRNKG